MTNTGKRTWAAVVLAISTACGGGEDGEGKAGPAVVMGPVQSIDGALTVNGVAFRTSGAALSADGAPATSLSGEAELRGRVAEGEVVEVSGVLDDNGGSGSAGEIRVRHSIEGELESRGPGRLVVAGVPVAIDGTTFVSDRNGNPLVSDDLPIGGRVEISGHGDGGGGLLATSVRVSADDSGTEREFRAFIVAISGTIVDLAFSPGAPAAFRVDVGGISPAPTLAVGDFVEVRTIGEPSQDGVLPATNIHRDDRPGARTGVRIEIEGIVTAVDSTGFEVGGQRVEAGSRVELRGGTAEDLVVGTKVEVEGTLRDDGVLVAREIHFRPSLRVEANAADVNPASGTLTLLGITVHVNPSTELRSLSGLGSLPAGATVEVRGTPTRDGTGIDATRLELRDSGPADRAFLRGVVQAMTPTSSLTILGIAVDTSDAQFRSRADAPMSASAFFDAVTPGQTIVKVRWRPYPASTAEPIDEAELEN